MYKAFVLSLVLFSSVLVAQSSSHALILPMNKEVAEFTPDQRAWVSQAILAGKYLDVTNNNGQVTMTITQKPDIGALVRIHQAEYRYRVLMHILDPDNNEAPGVLRTVAYIAAEVQDDLKKKEVDASMSELSRVLTKMLNADPQDESLQRAGDYYVAHLGIGEYYSLRDEREEVRRAVFAAKMGLSYDVLNWDGDFEKFLVANDIDKWRQYFGHTFSIGSQDDPMILYEGKLQNWNWIKPRIELNDKMRMVNHVYTYQGLVPGNPEQDIIAFNRINPNPYEGRYFLVLLGDEGILSNHVWVRLIDNDGVFYSAGWVGTGSWVSDWWRFWATDAKEGKIVSPDPMDQRYYYGHYFSMPIELTADEFQKAMDFLKEYQDNPNACYEGQATSMGTTGCGSFLRTVLQQIGLYTPPATYWRGVEDTTLITQWMQDEIVSRLHTIEKLKAEGASQDEINKVNFRKPRAD